MASIDTTRIAELKLAVGTSNLSDSVDLINWATGNNNARVSTLIEQYDVQGQNLLRGMSIDWIASGKANATGTKAMLRQITIPLYIAPDSPLSDSAGSGDVLVAEEQAIITKTRQIARGAGSGAQAASVWLWMRYVNNSNYVYWSCQEATWQPLLPKTIAQQVILGILTLTCLPYPFGDPTLDPVSAQLSATSPSIYKSAIPGDHAGATRIYLMDQSAGGKIAQRWSLYSRSLDTMQSGDWQPSYGITATSPATATSDSAAYNGTRAHLTTSTSWQNVGYAQSGSGAFETQEALTRLRVRDGAAVVGALEDPSISVGSTNSGGLGAGTYQLALVPRNSGGQAGPSSSIMQAVLSNLTQSGGGPIALNPLDLDFFTSGQFVNFSTAPTLTVGSGTGGSATMALDTTAAMGNPFGLHIKAVGGSTGASIAAIQRAIPLLPASKNVSVQLPFTPITMASGNGTTTPGQNGEFSFSFSDGSFVGIFWNSTRSKWSLQRANVDQGAAFDFTMPIAATTLNQVGLTLPASTITLTSAGSFEAASAAQPRWVQIGNQLVQYTGISGNNLTGCTGGTGAISNGAAVNQAHILEMNFLWSTEELFFRVYVDGALVAGLACGATSSSEVLPAYLTIQAHPATGNANSDEFYIGQYAVADQYIGAGTSFNGGSITVNATSGANTSTVDLYANSGGSSWIWLPNVTLPYTWTTPLPAGITLVTSPPTAVPPVQPSLVRVGVGVSLAEAQNNAASAPAVACEVSNNEWEVLDARHKALSNSVIPEGQTAPPWFAAVQVMNPGTANAPAFDCDELIPIPKDGGYVQVTCPLTLARPAFVQVDTRRDGDVSALWYDTGTLTTSGDIVTDATRIAATLDDGATVPGGWGIYPTGTGLTHGTVSTQARTQAPFSLLGTATTGGFAAAYVPKDTSSFHWIFSVSSGAESESIECYYDGSNFVLNREHSGSSHQVTIAHAVTGGTMVEVCGYWTASTIGLSVNGSAFTTAAASAIPTGLGANFDLWSKDNYATGGEIDGRGIWFVGFTGTPTATDAAGLYPVTPSAGLPVGLPVGAAPELSQFSAAANVSFIWDCRTSRYQTPTLLTTGTFNGELKLGPQQAVYAAYPEYYDSATPPNFISDAQNAQWTMRAKVMPELELLRGST